MSDNELPPAAQTIVAWSAVIFIILAMAFVLVILYHLLQAAVGTC